MVKLKSTAWGGWLFGVILLAYAVALPIGAKFGLVDDYLFLNTLLSGRKLDFLIMPTVGRFFPLTAQEYNVVSFFSLLPPVFYVYNMLQFFIVVFLLFKIIVLYIPEEKNNKKLTYVIVLLTIFSPGFVTAWFRLFIGERSAMMFFLLFFLMYLFYQKRQKYSYLVYGIIAANVALYYKEPGFLMLGAFGSFHLVSGWKVLNIRQKLFDTLIMVSATVFSLVYFFVVFVKKGPVSYGDTPYNYIITFVKNIFSYTLAEPFLMILLLGLLGYRFYEVIVRKEKLKPLHDATLFAGIVYVLFFLKFNVFNYHYLLPAYVFAAFAFVHFLINEKYIKRKFFKALVSIAFALYIFNALPVSLHLISYYKNVPNTFQNTLDFLTNCIEREGRRVPICLDGVDRGGGMEIYVSFASYMIHKGLSPAQFDFKSDIASRNSVLFSEGNLKSPFTVFRDPRTSQCESGDLLIVTPYTTKFVNQRYIDNLKKNYELLYHAQATFGIPSIGIKPFVKYLLMQYRQEQFPDDVMFSNNIFNRTDFYIFRKRS